MVSQSTSPASILSLFTASSVPRDGGGGGGGTEVRWVPVPGGGEESKVLRMANEWRSLEPGSASAGWRYE